MATLSIFFRWVEASETLFSHSTRHVLHLILIDFIQNDIAMQYLPLVCIGQVSRIYSAMIYCQFDKCL